jgi:hypothetical protein
MVWKLTSTLTMTLRTKTPEETRQIIKDSIQDSAEAFEQQYEPTEEDDTLHFVVDHTDGFVSIVLDGVWNNNITTFEGAIGMYRPISEQVEGIEIIKMAAEAFCAAAPGVEPDEYEDKLMGGTIESDDIIFKMEYDNTTEMVKKSNRWR